MAKQSFDLPLLSNAGDDDREVAVVLKALLPGDPSLHLTSVDPVAIFQRPSTPVLLQDEPTVTGFMRFAGLRVDNKGRAFPRRSRFAFPTSDCPVCHDWEPAEQPDRRMS